MEKKLPWDTGVTRIHMNALRECQAINAELLAALEAIDEQGKDANPNGDVVIPSEIWDLVQQSLAKAKE